MSYQIAISAPARARLLLPISFIILWSSGYIGGAIGLHYAEPFTMTFLRFATAGLLLLLIAFVMRAPWPESWAKVGHIAVVGLFMQAIQFGGLYSGMNHGVPAGVSALIVGTMPIFTALGAGWILKEKVSWQQWTGLLLGLVGVIVVVGNRITAVTARLDALQIWGNPPPATSGPSRSGSKACPSPSPPGRWPRAP